MNIDFLKHNKSVVHISDRFRSIRFAMRNLKNTIDQYEEKDKKAIPLIGTVSALANASDSALSNVEHKLHNRLSSDAKKHFGMATACSLLLYVNGPSNADANADPDANTTEPPGNSNQKRRSAATGNCALQFAGDQYFASKRIAIAFGIDNVLMHQTRFLNVWLEYEETLISSLSMQNDELSEQSVYYVCSRFAQLLRSHTVIVFPGKHTSIDESIEYDTNILVAATTALVACVATYCDCINKRIDPDAIYNNSISLTRYHYKQISGIFEGEDAEKKFQEFLTIWTPRLS